MVLIFWAKNAKQKKEGGGGHQTPNTKHKFLAKQTPHLYKFLAKLIEAMIICTMLCSTITKHI
jgi:hypothetical protein